MSSGVNHNMSYLVKSSQNQYHHGLIQSNQIDGGNYEIDGVKHESDGVNHNIDGENHVKGSHIFEGANHVKWSES